MNNCNSTNGERMNKLLFKAFALILLVATIFFVFGVGDVSAAEWNVTPGGSIQTAVDNAGENDTINVQGNGSEYTYHENVIVNKTGLIIQASAPITVQAANPNNPVFTINSEGSGSTIQSFRITGATGTGSTGILLEGTTNCNILYNTIEGNAEGITLIGSTFNTVYANIIQNNYGTGILLAFSPQNNLTGNSIHYNGNGISLEMSGNNILRNNDLSNYYYYSTRGYNFGVSGYAEDYIQDIDTSNTINWNPIYYLVGQSDQTLEYIYGGYIALVNCNNITVNSASMYYNDKGIVLVNTTNSTIESGSFSYNIDGIYLLDSSYNTIKDNSVYENYDLKKKEKSGIHLENSHYNTVYNNYAHNNNVGLSLIMSSGNLIYDNSLNNNFESGIYVLGSSSNTLTSNHVNNNLLGLDLRGFSTNNIIYNNNFNNTVQVIVESGSTGNQFNLGYPYGGNFWSNYTGINRGDGIGNIPYYFSGGQDNLPYVGQVLNVFPGDSIGETIQNLANTGDNILVNDDHGTPYTYFENIEINKRINLRALGSVTIQASDTGQPIIQIVSGGDGTLIRGFNITGSTNGVGIIIQFANNCNITGNNITNNRDGIDIGSGNGNTFTDNILSNNSAIGMSIYESSYNTLRNNTISGSEMNFYLVGWGTLSNYYHDIDTSNTADGKPIYYLRNHSGETYNRTSMGYLALIECSNMTLLNLNITHSGEGVLLVATNNSTINNCSFQDNGEGIRLEMSSSGNNLNSNNITGNSQYGIEISDSDNNTLTSNTVNNNVRGIYLTGSTGNNLSGNIITNSTLQNFSVDSESGIDGYLNTILTNNTINGDPIYYLQGLNHQTIDGNLLSIGYLALVQCNNMIIQNLNLMGNGQGIVLAGCSNITLQNSTFTDNGDGIKLYNTINSTITNNSVNGSSGTYNALSGILMNASSGNNISNNSIDNTGSGIRLQEGSNNNILTNNTATNVHWGALSISMSSENLLRNTTLTTTGGGTQITIYGTELSHYYQDIDTSNTIDAKPLYYLRNRTGETYDGVSMGYLGMVECSNMTILNIALSNVNNGILLVATNNSTIQDCSFSYNVEGIFLWNSSNNHILNNIVNNNIAEGRQSGIHLENGSNNNEIRENDVYENEAGIVILGSSGNTVSNNTVHDNWYDGIRVDQNSQNNTLHGNTCTSNGNTIYSSNGGSGIVIDTNSTGTVVSGNLIEYNGNGLSILNGSHDNTIVGNDIDDNYGWSNSDIGYGVLIKGNSHNNLIYNNNICWNNIQAYVESACTGNLFNKPEWVGGNYWAYYYYYDRGDGFGNTPYVFTGGQDNLPYTQWINNVFPGESIQDAVNNIDWGGNVLVHDNLGQTHTYIENVFINSAYYSYYYGNLRIKADGDVTVSAADPNVSVFSIGSSGSQTTIQGFNITGASLNYNPGISLYETNNIQILNNTIFGNVFGMDLYRSNNINITGNTIYNNTINGISIHHYCTNNTVLDNNINNNGEFGIALNNAANNNLITRNQVNNNGFNQSWGGGISLQYVEEVPCTGNEISWNNVSGNNNDGISLSQSHTNNITYNNVTNNGGNGITNWISNNNTISNNNVTNNGVTNEWGTGILICGDHDQGVYSEENQVNNNYVTGNRNFGINISDAHNNTISSNTVENNGYGYEGWAEIKLYFANNNIISNNIIFNNFDDHGISMHNASNNQIFNNQITNTTRGIDAYEQSNNNVFNGNTVTNARELGIYVRDSTSNTYTGNQLSGGYSRLQIFGDPGVFIMGNNISNLDWYDDFNPQCGIDLGESQGSSIINNTLTNAGGISIWLSNGCNIFFNTLIYSPYGINLQQSANCSIFHNALLGSGIILSASPESTLTNNNITTTSPDSPTLDVQTWNDDINDFRQYIDSSNTINGKPIQYILDANNLLIDSSWIIGYLALVQCNNVTIHGINMNNTGRGIFLAGTNNTIIGGYQAGEGCTFANNDVGIELWQSFNNLIINNHITDNQEGILIRSNSGDANNTLNGNSLTNNILGIVIEKSAMNTLLNNNITSNSTDARNLNVETGGDDSTIYDFRQNIDTTNTINGKTIYYIMDASNLLIGSSWNPGYLALVNCNNISIIGLNMANNGQGILLAGTNNSTIGGYQAGEPCNFQNNNQGIFLFGSSANQMINNQILNNTHNYGNSGVNGQTGIHLEHNSDDNTIIFNYLSDNDSGILLSSSSYNTVENNVLINTLYTGIQIGGEIGGFSDFYTGGVNNVILNNIINGCEYEGISIGNSPNNQIINNTISNTCNTTNIYAMDWISALTLTGANGTLVYGNQIVNNYLTGILITDLEWQGAYSEYNQIISNNIIGNWVGILVNSDSSTNIINFNRIVNNTECQLRYNGENNALNATYNWWGSNNEPTHGECQQIEGLVNYSPWLYMTFIADPVLIPNGLNSTLTADFNNAYDGSVVTALDPAGGHLPDGSVVVFTTDLGSVGSKITNKITSNGIATATLIADEGVGIANLSAQLDNQTLYSNVEIFELYVNGLTGNDTWDGRSPTHIAGTNTGPMKTIQTAIDALIDGGAINVATGTYSESIVFDHKFILMGAGSSTTILIPASSGYNALLINSGGWGSAVSGFNITGAIGVAGILLNSVNNTSIINNTLSGNTLGIALSNAGNNSISDTLFVNNGAALQIYRSNLNTVTNCTFTSNDYGLYLLEGNNNTINNSLFTVTNGNGRALYLESGQGNQITYNTITGGVYGIESLNDLQNTYNGNDVSNTAWRDLYLTNPVQDVITGNRIHDTINGLLLLGGSENQLTGNTLYGCGSGLEVVNSLNNTLYNNNITQNTFGMYIYGNTGTTISQNNVTGCGSAIELHDSSLNMVSNNSLVQNTFGVYIAGGSLNRVIDNVVFNTSYGGAGVHFENSSNNTISNNSFTSDVKDFRYGIYVNEGSNNTITNNTASNNHAGLELHSTSVNQVTGNDLINNTVGLFMDGSSGNVFTSNTVNGNGAGVEMHDSHLNIFNNVSVSSSTFGFIIFNGNNNTIINSVLNSNGAAINLQTCINSTIDNNQMNNNSYGVYILNGDHNLVQNSEITDIKLDGSGVFLDNTTQNMVKGNSFINTEKLFTYGIYQIGRSSNVLESNTAIRNHAGIELHDTMGNLILSNNLSYNTLGVFMWNSSQNNLTFNTINNNGAGIEVHQSTQNNLTGNNLTSNVYGMYLDQMSSSNIKINDFNMNTIGLFSDNSSSNEIYTNNFYSNTTQAYDTGTNNWDNGTDTGNYWDNYGGSGTYAIPGGSNVDNYPSMTPFE